MQSFQKVVLWKLNLSKELNLTISNCTK